MRSTAIIKRVIIGLVFSVSMQASIASGFLPVLGLNLCGNTTESQIKKIAQANGGTTSDLVYDDSRRESEMRISGYQIAGRPRDIDFTLFRGVLFAVKIDDAEDLEEVLRARYGKPIRQTSDTNTGILRLAKYFNSKVPSVDISINYMGSSSWIHYVCTRVEKQRISEIERLEKSEALKKPGAEKL